MLALIIVLFESILFLVCLPVIINILTLNEVEIIEDEEI